MTPAKRLRRIRIWLILFIIGLALSGATAFPLVTELRWVTGLLHSDWLPAPAELVDFLDRVRVGVEAADRDYPFLAYGTDWLAFAHLVIAMAFWGPLRDPVRNIWIIHWGMLCCVAVVPLALVAGPIRGLPWWWLPIDISFGVGGIIPLLIVRRQIRLLEQDQAQAQLPAPDRPAAPAAA